MIIFFADGLQVNMETMVTMKLETQTVHIVVVVVDEQAKLSTIYYFCLKMHYFQRTCLKYPLKMERTWLVIKYQNQWENLMANSALDSLAKMC